ncbi:MAG TPA: hypothetical protein VEH48_01240 [Candidatus Nitrosopolaris sp.]|nr:hypothetical protein [Candidatus Nitrosopolaris sp.]
MKPEQETNLYRPDDTAATDSGQKSRKTKAISWTASEYIEHQHGAGWYLSLVVLTAALAAILYLLTKDYFAAGVIVVLGIIVGVSAGRKPRQMSFELSSSGLKAGEKSYSYNLFKSFSVLHEGAQTSLNFIPVKRFMPPVSAYFEPKDEDKITSLVGEHLPYEERRPSAIDRLSFRLRL